MTTEKYDKGMKIRREVLGDEHVDRALSSANDFSMAMQNLATENCWGETWANGVLPRPMRSLITIAILASLKASTELKGHVRGALRNGCTVAEIQDVLLHCAVYCGVPAGIEAFRAAKEVIEEWQSEGHTQ